GEVRALRQRLGSVLLGEARERLLRVKLVTLAAQPLGVLDPPGQLAPEPVLLLVRLAERVELRGGPPPRAVRLRLRIRGRAIVGDGLVTGRDGLREPVLRERHDLL